MIVRYWGTRGTIPVPGAGTVRYGGDTSCVSIETGEAVLVLDAGTGIRALGDALRDDPREIYVLLTHIHADHVQGFPYFWPLWEEGRRIHLLVHEWEGRVWSPLSLLDGTHFPVLPDRLPSDIQVISSDPMAFLRDRGWEISRLAVNHPGGAYGYRVDSPDGAVVHIPDNEIVDGNGALETELVTFCRGARLLSHDAQWLSEELCNKAGWGHSTVEDTCGLGRHAEVRQLLLFHHDPWRDDQALDGALARARHTLEDSPVAVDLARDGMQVRLGDPLD